jgi:CheY-like chemotaxis protein
VNKVVVLYVDGEPLDVMYLRRAIRAADLPIELLTVSDGQFAIEWLQGKVPFCDRKAYPLPELIVTDLQLPLISGFEVLRYVRSDLRFQNLPIVVHSKSQFTSDAENSIRLGALSYFHKTKCCSSLIDFLRGWLAIRLEDELEAERNGGHLPPRSVVSGQRPDFWSRTQPTDRPSTPLATTKSVVDSPAN